MRRYRIHFNNSFQRAIALDSNRFYKRFNQILVTEDPRITELFVKTDMDRMIEMLKQSMTYMMSFSATLEDSDELKAIAEKHSNGRLNIPADFYDIWLNCMIKTVKEFNPKFEKHIETSWRVLMAPGVEYMKSYCKQ